MKSKLKKDNVKSKLSFDHFENFCKAKNLAENGLKTGGTLMAKNGTILYTKKTTYIYIPYIYFYTHINVKIPM